MSYTANKSSIPSFKYRYELMDTGLFSPTPGDLGFGKANGTYNIGAGTIGIMLGPFVIIGSCALKIPDINYDSILTPQYFPYHDLIDNSLGISRSGAGNLGGGWANDACGFYFLLPDEAKNARKFIFEYSYITTENNHTNKHGLKFYYIGPSGQPDGDSGSSNYDFLGTWDNVFYANLPNDSTIKKI